MSERDFAWLLGVLVVIIGFILLLTSGLWGGYAPGMMGMMGYGWGFMFLIPLAFLVLIALGIYYLVTETTRPSRSTFSSRGRALEILKERYARGEITEEQYLKMRKELE